MKMNPQTRTWIAIGLLIVGGGIALLYTASRFVPKMTSKFMRGMMQSMMKEMTNGEGGCNPQEM